MKRVLITIGFLVGWLLVVAGVFIAEEWLKRPPIFRGNFKSLEQHLVQKLNAAAANQELGAAALVLVQNGQIVTERGFGIANIRTGEAPKTDHTLFFLASVSKEVTSWGVMKLVQEGKIGLDEPIAKYLKRWRFPKENTLSEKLTIRHLLSHTGGIVDGFGSSGFSPRDTVQTLEQNLSFPKDANMGEAHGTTVSFEPGTNISYSNAGYGVLQLLVEEITQLPFDVYMRENVLTPLGMTRSGYDLDTLIAKWGVDAFVPNYDLSLKTHPLRRYANKSGVSLRVTARDLGKFLEAYGKDNPVLKKQTLQQMFVPQNGTSGSWALGHEVFIENNSGGHIVGHGGGAFPRTGASIWLNPATGNGIGILMTGGPEMINPYVEDWIYWEIGKKKFDIRNVFHNRFTHTLVIYFAGVIIFLIYRFKYKRR